MLQKSFANSRTAGTGTREFRPKWKKILVCGLDFKLLCCRRAAYFRLEEWKYFRWTEKPNRWEMVKGTNETHTQWPTILTIRPKECENWKTTTENKDKMDFERFVIIPFVCVCVWTVCLCFNNDISVLYCGCGRNIVYYPFNLLGAKHFRAEVISNNLNNIP